jgi:hypothetical protein
MPQVRSVLWSVNLVSESLVLLEDRKATTYLSSRIGWLMGDLWHSWSAAPVELREQALL